MPLKPRMNMKPYTVTRTTVVDPAIGRKVAGAVTSVPITANVRPGGRALQVLEEGRRQDDVQSVYTATALCVTGTVIGGVTFDCDVLTLNGEAYEVLHVDGWPGHYECLAARQVKP